MSVRPSWILALRYIEKGKTINLQNEKKLAKKNAILMVEDSTALNLPDILLMGAPVTGL